MAFAGSYTALSSQIVFVISQNYAIVIFSIVYSTRSACEVHYVLVVVVTFAQRPQYAYSEIEAESRRSQFIKTYTVDVVRQSVAAETKNHA